MFGGEGLRPTLLRRGARREWRPMKLPLSRVVLACQACHTEECATKLRSLGAGILKGGSGVSRCQPFQVPGLRRTVTRGPGDHSRLDLYHGQNQPQWAISFCGRNGDRGVPRSSPSDPRLVPTTRLVCPADDPMAFEPRKPPNGRGSHAWVGT